MAKKRTINEIRQTKEYYTGNDPVKQIMAQQIEELAERDHQEKLDKASAEGSTKYFPKEECPLDLVEEAKILIVDKIVKHLDDVLFEMVCKEMGKNYLFQSQNYLTEAGYDEFEDTWFEFYREHHSDILYQVMKNITN